ncbi:NAD(P)H-hydrate dehydratase [Oryzicola mucosus]
MREVLTPSEMAEADRRTIAEGNISGIELMRAAGSAITAEILARYPCPLAHILCGPGNNGGDGYVVARLLAQAGVPVKIWASAPPRESSDAAIAAAEAEAIAAPLAELSVEPGALVVDALYGAGLSKPLGSLEEAAFAKLHDAGAIIVAVDLPSGVSGDSGAVLGAAPTATLTVTFARKKPAHLLLPGKVLCGEVVVADIGIPDQIVEGLNVACFENDVRLWGAQFPKAAVDAHKYRRGHVGVFSAGPSATGAARLSAMAAARAGAGAVTLLSPANALAINAAHLTSIILRRSDGLPEAVEFLEARKPDALVYGPGLGPHPETGRFAVHLLNAARGLVGHIVLDADGLTASAPFAAELFAAAREKDASSLVLTPHEGEFGRLFPAIAADKSLSKLEKSRKAAAEANAIVLYKGADTVVAAPDGRASISTNGTPLLATAGSGDVLSGIVAALLAQKMPPFEAASAAVWLHAEAARRFGPGLIAEDLPMALLPALRALDAQLA